MPKIGIGPIRRKQLIEATVSMIHESELGDPTLSEISAKAGLSTSIVNHYFKSKKKLFEETMRELASGFIGEVTLRVSVVDTPMEKINAIIDANFAPSQCTPEAVSAWLWFWARVPVSDEFAKIEQVCDRHLQNELRSAVEQLVPIEVVEDVVEGIIAIMYGLWVRFAHDPKKINIVTAQRITKSLVVCRVNAYQSVDSTLPDAVL